LKRLLADDFELVGMVEDGRELVLAAKKLQPDVAILDISMPRLNGIDAMEFHKYQMMETHGLHSNAELIHFAIKHGIVTI
jgi:chemotaxis response regulator CheB